MAAYVREDCGKIFATNYTHRIRGGQVQPISDPKEPKSGMPKFEDPLPLFKRFMTSAQCDMLSQNFQHIIPKYYDLETLISFLFLDIIFAFFNKSCRKTPNILN